ncbi:MAG: enoyl-CoA hydratase/isomerase family protein [Gammaproteobacteria bacterium]|nr:MAG: enoyl-CoA hydratase/isomerase family protein [Gammaproteobacteria bacterium]
MSNDITLAISDYVATIEIHRPPNNFFDFDLIREIADAYQLLDDDADCRAIVLCSQGKHFCAGANFQNRGSWGNEQLDDQARQLYVEAVRIFNGRKPVVAAVHGAAIGGGLGLALSADFRVTCEQARFSANFVRLGFHQGFGLSVTLPRLIGHSKASLLLFTGRRVKGDEAVAMGLADELVAQAQVRDRARALACEIAGSAPLALQSIRATLRSGLAEEIARITDHELAEQSRLRSSEDFREGIAAMNERRKPDFKGR